MKNRNVIFVMGVSGSGKSTIANDISNYLSCTYIDADDVHPQQNIDKMSQGIPLTDDDRLPWLKRLNTMASDCTKKQETVVIACSCLKPEYRAILQHELEQQVIFVYLKGSLEIIEQRLKNRAGHFFSGSAMLKNQFDTLIEPSINEPITYLTIDTDPLSGDQVTQAIVAGLGR